MQIHITPPTVETAMQSLARAREFYRGDNGAFARKAIRNRLRLLQRAIERELAALASEPAPRA